MCNMKNKINLIFSLVSLLLITACDEQPETEPVAPMVFTQRIADTHGLTERVFPGRASAGQEVNLSFRVSGPLITLPVKVGDHVKKGDTIARIDPRDYESALRTTQGQLERERARMKRTKADLDRLESIFRTDPGAISEAAVDESRQLYESARASVNSIGATVSAAQDQLNYTTLEAPFDGVIVETYVENFETMFVKQPVLRLLNPSNIKFIINVPENLIGYVSLVEDIQVKFDALPDIFVSASIKEVGKEASQATRTYPVTLVMEQPEGAEILSGMAGQAYSKAKLPDTAKETGIEVPATALFTKDDSSKSFLWVIDESSNTISRREVKTGRLSKFGVLIKSGINADELIVTKGVHSLHEGQKIQIIDDSKEGKSL
jgi:membrane fusion protein, multidrug efflux system